MKIDRNALFPSLGVLCMFLLPVLSGCSTPNASPGEASAAQQAPGFSFDCSNTPSSPCRTLTATHEGRPVPAEPSSLVWSEPHGQAIVVSDNFNDLVDANAAHYIIAYFDPHRDSPTIPVLPLLSQQQAADFRLYDLEGVALRGNRLYAIGSLALHGKNPGRDRWERHQFVQMDLQQSEGLLWAENLSHVARRWPNFRDWLISKSGQDWTAEATRGRAEGAGINVEALSSTAAGNLIIGFRGPLSTEGGALALEIKMPASPDEEPVLVRQHRLPPLDVPHIPKGAAKTLRGMRPAPGEPGEFYVLLGPIGYEKEEVVLAHWNANSGQLTKATLLPKGFVAEGVAPIGGGKVLVVDDLKAMVLIATEH